MTEGSEVRATHEEVEAFVDKLKGFHSSLESAQGGETAGYRRAKKRYGDPDEGGSEQEPSSGWNDLIGWIEEQGEEDTQGFAIKVK